MPRPVQSVGSSWVEAISYALFPVKAYVPSWQRDRWACICGTTCLENLHALPFCPRITLMFHEDNVNAGNIAGEESQKKLGRQGSIAKADKPALPRTGQLASEVTCCMRHLLLSRMKGRVAPPLLSVSLCRGNLKQENTVSPKYYTVWVTAISDVTG